MENFELVGRWYDVIGDNTEYQRFMKKNEDGTYEYLEYDRYLEYDGNYDYIIKEYSIDLNNYNKDEIKK